MIGEMIREDIETLNRELAKYGIRVEKFLAKGTTSFVFLGSYANRPVIVKFQRSDSPRRNLKKEAEILKMLEGENITGELVLYDEIKGREVLVREFIEGELLINSDIERKHVISIAEKTYRLDRLGIDHGQIQGGKHIIVAPTDVWLIDFEKASMNRKPRNLTSAMAMLFLGENRIAERITKKFNVNKKFREELLVALREYKKSGNPKRIFDVLSTL
ncbi:serine/threonine protein kinase [Pyrococcus abyssi]|uniref:Serine/threonine protein kinase n=1 Tax=Pyrococcus abyssi (strain GE5 / Orsay) TaxID=272844 RepID=Q9V0E9_PYRAB|nr:serine/threonine protein kinase [Pyrococcus abyssi]CAB49754.1 Predicted protein kinase, putative [Pyrococcus abyssi GE5]CCE70244.1 TPA: hypothetical protein PAB0564 [Pyrococcus abyssi GE5]